MKIGSILENQSIEKRVAITPDIVKKYKSLGFDILLSKNYGNHLGILDKEYSELGVEIVSDDKDIIKNSDLIAQLGMLSGDKSSLIRENQSLIGVLDPYNNKEQLENLAKKKNKSFFIRVITKNHKSSVNGYTFFTSKSCWI